MIHHFGDKELADISCKVFNFHLLSVSVIAKGQLSVEVSSMEPARNERNKALFMYPI